MKDFAITRIILKRPVTAMMLSLMVVGFGLFSLSNLKVTLYPSYEIPVMGISVNYSNVSPDDMLRLVVEPIEAVVMGVEGVESLDSNVRRGGGIFNSENAPRDRYHDHRTEGTRSGGTDTESASGGGKRADNLSVRSGECPDHDCECRVQ